MENLRFFLIVSLVLSSSCGKMSREKEVDKDKLLGYDYRLFQGTRSWEIAKAVWDDDRGAIQQVATRDKSLLNIPDPVFGYTLLMFTIWNDQYQTFKYLLELGADVNIHDQYTGSSAIIEACNMKNNNIDYLRLLIEHGAIVNDVEVGDRKEGNSTRDSPLIAASRNGNMDAVRLLIAPGARLNYQNEFEQSAISEATLQDEYEIVFYLLQKGADAHYSLGHEKIDTIQENI